MRMLQISMLLLALGTAIKSTAIHAADPQSPLFLEQPLCSFTGEIKGNHVRMRLAPHTDGTIIREFSKGDLVAVIGENKDYYLISPPPGMTGYVFRSFVIDNIIEGEHVNVRLEPSTSAPVLVRLSRGTEIQTTSSTPQGKWLEIVLPSQCAFYVAKNFVTNKGPIELYTQREGQKKIALDLINAALDFARIELEKNLSDIDLEAIYKKINLVQCEEFKDVPGIQGLVQKALEEIQDIYLSKSLEVQDSSNGICQNSMSTVPNSPTVGTSLLSRHIRKQTTLKTAPLTQGRENLEYSLFKIWTSMQQSNDGSESLTQEAFYRAEQKKKQILVGILEVYPHLVKNNPGDYLLKDQEHTIAFLYGTNINLEEWLGKRVTVECLPRPNNHFAFPAYYVIGIKEVS
ncbi:Bacterial SH3 domain [Chlamydia serpentis]|uniref:Bacterial SH3 domain n=1 Tax=Chlamydia serpentis TaxID=1967782 RepID=A0A2R8FA76_9CHLA|nr:SH3 domain-containing protein [Chlamydia serpentis]SPN73271.1 Bacterial SH3 domain [Chlamydia serpentis]